MPTPLPVDPVAADTFIAHLQSLQADSEHPLYFVISALAARGGCQLELYVDGAPPERAVLITITPTATYLAIAPAAPANPYDCVQAGIEGWGMFETEGRWQLQRIDDDPKFRTDTDAILYVADRARAGSAMHLAALDMIGTLAP